MTQACCSTTAIHQPALEFRLIPAGRFRANDGRPHRIAGWLMDGISAKAIIAALAAQKNDLLIDYEHQSLHTQETGGPAPAAGWFKRLQWREGDGLYVTDARWTRNAAARLSAGEYRYISPVFQFDETTGRVLSIIGAAVTNKPALDGLTDLAAAAGKLPISPGTRQVAALAAQEAAHMFTPADFHDQAGYLAFLRAASAGKVCINGKNQAKCCNIANS